MNKEEFKKELIEMLEEDETQKTENLNECLYMIDDILVGGFENGIRGLDHNVLLFDNVEWEDILTWGTVIVPESQTYISDNEIEELENLGYTKLPLNNNHLVGFKNQKFDIDENKLSIEEQHFYKVCMFEKSHYEDIYMNENDEIIFLPDNNFPNENVLIYDSFENLYEDEGFNERLSEDLDNLLIEDITDTLGNETLNTVTKNDIILKEKYLDSIKGLDLDNDGTPDRIDSDKNRNSVQTQSDLSTVGNKTSKETQDLDDDMER